MYLSLKIIIVILLLVLQTGLVGQVCAGCALVPSFPLAYAVSALLVYGLRDGLLWAVGMSVFFEVLQFAPPGTIVLPLVGVSFGAVWAYERIFATETGRRGVGVIVLMALVALGYCIILWGSSHLIPFGGAITVTLGAAFQFVIGTVLLFGLIYVVLRSLHQRFSIERGVIFRK